MNKIEMIKQVREKTGFGLADAAQAVAAVNIQSVEKAIEWAKKQKFQPHHRESAKREGIVKTYTHNDRIAAMVEVNCETDFVSHNTEFQDLVHCVLLQVVGTNPLSIDELMEQPFVRDESVKIKELVESVSKSTKENIKISRFIRWIVSG